MKRETWSLRCEITICHLQLLHSYSLVGEPNTGTIESLAAMVVIYHGSMVREMFMICSAAHWILSSSENLRNIESKLRSLLLQLDMICACMPMRL